MTTDNSGSESSATRKLNDNYATVNLSPAEAQEALKKAQAANNYATVNLSPAEAQEALKKAQAQANPYATTVMPAADAQAALQQAQQPAAQPNVYTDPTPSMYLGTPSAPLKMPEEAQAQWQAVQQQQAQWQQQAQQQQAQWQQQPQQQQAPQWAAPTNPKQIPWPMIAIGTAIILLIIVAVLVLV